MAVLCFGCDDVAEAELLRVSCRFFKIKRPHTDHSLLKTDCKLNTLPTKPTLPQRRHGNQGRITKSTRFEQLGQQNQYQNATNQNRRLYLNKIHIYLLLFKPNA